MIAKVVSGCSAAKVFIASTCEVYTPAGFSVRAWTPLPIASMVISGWRKCGTVVTMASTSPESSIARWSS